MFRKALLPIPAAVFALALSACSGDSPSTTASTGSTPPATPAVSIQDAATTATPIKHLVVIFGENVSFDHY
ncbi:MAG TPA: phospholipase, partial [Paraburkholderia sp.]